MSRFPRPPLFEVVLAALIDGARAVYRLVSTARQQVQLRLLIITALAAGSLPFLMLGYKLGTLDQTLLDPVFAVLWLLGSIAAIGAATQAKFHRLAALAMVGIAGLATCISFVWLSAPDLGLTQLLVEIVTLVLLLLGLRWLPQRLPELWRGESIPFHVRFRRSGDLLLAVFGGGGAAAIAYAVMTRRAPDGIGDFFMQRAYSGGGGTNVVNVILVDFRSFDTLGEITVLTIVALTVFTLLRRFRPAAESVEIPDQQKVQNAFDDAHDDNKFGDTAKHYLLVPRVIMEWLFPVILTCALYLLMRGHDLPGGGFAGGITASIAIIMLYMGSGTRSVEARLHIQPVRWIAAGLLCATATGAAAWFFGYPFLSTHFRYLDLPIIGEIPLASALLFDIGVFAVVVGTTILILIALAHQSIRTPTLRPSPTRDPADGDAPERID